MVFGRGGGGGGAMAPAVVGEVAGVTGPALAAFGIQAVTGASDAVRDPLADYPGGALSGVERLPTANIITWAIVPTEQTGHIQPQPRR